MLAFPSMLVAPAKDAGMKAPPDADNFPQEEYPHFAYFCALQLCRRMQPGEQWENAKIIAAVSDDEIKTMTLEGFLARGLTWAQG